MQKIVKRTRHERSYMEEDFGPDYLMAANGGLNPKRKKIYEENVEVEYRGNQDEGGQRALSPVTNFESVG